MAIESIKTKEPNEPGTVRWNLAVLSVDVIFYWLGAAFTDPLTVLLVLMHQLGANNAIIGAAVALRLLAQYGLQVFVAYVMHGKPHQKPFLVRVVGLARLPLLLLPFLVWRSETSEGARNLALWGTVGILTLLALGEGLGGVPWTEIIARAFTDKVRGRFLTGTQIACGVLTILIAAFVVRPVLDWPGLPYPHNFAVLIGISALMFQVSTLGLVLLKEPPAPPGLQGLHPRPLLGHYLRRLPRMIHEDRTFARLVMIQLLINAGWACSPFYVNYANQHFSLGEKAGYWAGTYQMLQAISIAMLMPVWAFLSEKRSPAMAVRGVALVCMLTPLVAITFGHLSPLHFGLVFLLMGGSLTFGGVWVVTNHFLLSHADEDDRPLFIGLLNLLNVPIAIYPLLGSLLAPEGKEFVEFAGIPILPVLTSLIVGVGFLLSFRLSLKEPAAEPPHLE